MKKNKAIGLIIIGLIYLFTIGVGVGTYFLLPNVIKNQALLTMLIIDIICTIVIYLFSTIFKNSSIYDPYWSVAPIVIYPGYLLATDSVNVYTIIFVLVVAFWSFRLTINWALGFKNLGTQDWRYQNFKEKHPKVYFLIDLFGIHLFPTIMVFIGMLPGFFFIEKAVTTQLNVSFILSCLVMVLATVIEMVADIQMYNFRKNPENKGKVMSRGLWKNSRHPNYLGEILFWIGIWLAYFGTEADFMKAMITAVSPIVIFCMFVFISIPMLEKRQLKNKPAYKDYMECSSMLLPIPVKSKK